MNADGFLDLLITGLDYAGVGPHDVVVFASNAPGAPPVSTRLMDDSVKQFATDLLEYLQDPSYFNGAYQFVCSYYWILAPEPQWDIDGHLYWIGVPIWVPSCWWQQNPSFSSAALGMGSAVASVLAAGEISQGSPHAYYIASEFEQLFGTPFMGGVLQSGGLLPADMAYLSDLYDTVLEAHEEILLKVHRALRVTTAFYQAAKWKLGAEGQPGPHEYEAVTIVCQTSQAGCTLQKVFAEMRRYPVRGCADQCGNVPRSQCNVVVQTGHETEVYLIDSPVCANGAWQGQTCRRSCELPDYQRDAGGS